MASKQELAQLDRRIRTTKPDPQRKVRISCGEGLALVVNKGGTKKFVSRLRLFNGSSAIDFAHDIPYPTLTVSEALDHHRELKKKIKAGIDPRQEQYEIALAAWSEPTLGEIADLYFDAVKPLAEPLETEAKGTTRDSNADGKLRESTHKDYLNRYNRWLKPFAGDLKLKNINSALCIRLLQKVRTESGNDTNNKGNGNRTASVCRTVMSQIFNHAVFLGHVDVTANPMLGISDKMLKVKQQHANDDRRYLNTLELVETWKMLDLHAHARYLFPVTVVALQIAILTGMRRQEIVGMRYSELEPQANGGAVYHIPKARMKKGVQHKVYLSPYAISLISTLPKISDRVFQSTRTGVNYESKTITKNALNNGILSILGKRKSDRPKGHILTMEKFSPHDLRRSFSTGLRKEFKASKSIIHAMIAHGAGEKDEIEFDPTLDLIYIQSDEFSEHHSFWQQWSDLIEGFIKPSDER